MLAKANPAMGLTSLNHYVDYEWVKYAYECTRKDGAVGVDGQTAEEYAANLEQNLLSLIDRLKSGRYNAPPVRRHYIPKTDGGQRGLGIPCFEDKIAQRAIVMLLEPIYEHEFLDCSFGFRPARNAHQALQAVRGGIMGKGRTVGVDVDVRKYFDSITGAKLREFLDQKSHGWRGTKIDRQVAQGGCAGRWAIVLPGRRHSSRRGDFTLLGKCLSPLRVG